MNKKNKEPKLYTMSQMISMAHSKMKMKLTMYRLVDALELACAKKHGEYGREKCANCLLVAKIKADFPLDLEDSEKISYSEEVKG